MREQKIQKCNQYENLMINQTETQKDKMSKIGT